MGLLHPFCAESGEMINLHKSFVKFSPNTPQDYNEALGCSLRLRVAPSFGSYLGLPMDLGRSKVNDFGFLIDKVAALLASFASLRLSAAAKLIIINSILVASFNHVLSVFKIPSTICSHIDNLLARFWWRSSVGSKGLALRSASLLHLPKGLGGLGIRNIGCFNSALLARQGDRMSHNPQLLVSRLLFSKYPTRRSRPELRILRSSWGCRSLQVGFSTLASGTMWKVGIGSQVRILADTWVPNGPPTLREGVSESNLPNHVSSLIDPRSNAWDTVKVHRMFDAVMAVRILALERPSQRMDDFFYWKHTRDGIFLTKSAYTSLVCATSHRSGTDLVFPQWWRRFWGLPLLPKWKVFGWKLLRNALPVAAVLIQRGISVDPLCSFCHVEEETVGHLFRDCEVVKHLFLRSSLAFSLHDLSAQSFQIWLVDVISTFSSSKDWNSLTSLFALLWVIWISINNFRFRWQSLVSEDVLVLASSWVIRCQEAQRFVVAINRPLTRIPSGLFGSTFLLSGDSSRSLEFCVILDSSWSVRDNTAGVGWVFRTPDSSLFLGGGARATCASSAIHAELLAC
ncbi:uncharacterized protein LOC110702265 [Chenopodium quinoa]|uniref:uncharacterized protein LOC110702265 n=1 Tax=Chenopodium quinoa TaxID=63459 RepID=UPI000B790B0C|nr:uncharacterized protein LOC110702265 [Chenopodium quinoa]